MKKACIITIVLLLGGAAAFGGVADTKHNFTSAASSPNAYFTGASQVCAFCHTPHNAGTEAPLFNHQVSPPSYTPYTSSTMDMTRTPQPTNGSLVCLSCHDGTIAVNSLNDVPGPNGAGSYGSPAGADLDGAGKLTASSNAYVGQDLSDDHPVGIIYDQTLDNDFAPKTGNTLAYPDKLLYQGTYVECSSCHDPHDNTYGDFLVEDNGGSNLCLRCHTK